MNDWQADYRKPSVQYTFVINTTDTKKKIQLWLKDLINIFIMSKWEKPWAISVTEAKSGIQVALFNQTLDYSRDIVVSSNVCQYFSN